MTKMKLLASVLLTLAVLFAQVGSAAAAPQTQDGTVTVTGTVTAIGTPQTDANGVTTVPVTITDANGVETTILVSEADAANLTVGQTDVTLTGNVAPPEETEPDVHPISALLADFFGVDPALVDSYHTGDNEADQVFGFGVIAQALWMATVTGEDGTTTTDAELAGLILQAKKSGDYTEIAAQLDLPTVPTNWGMLKKALKDRKGSLGDAVSSEKSGKPHKEKGPKPDHGKPDDKGKGKP